MSRLDRIRELKLKLIEHLLTEVTTFENRQYTVEEIVAGKRSIRLALQKWYRRLEDTEKRKILP